MLEFSSTMVSILSLYMPTTTQKSPIGPICFSSQLITSTLSHVTAITKHRTTSKTQTLTKPYLQLCKNTVLRSAQWQFSNARSHKIMFEEVFTYHWQDLLLAHASYKLMAHKTIALFFTFASCLTDMYGALPWSGSGGPLYSKMKNSLNVLNVQELYFTVLLHYLWHWCLYCHNKAS